jgi:hypothetical protein
MISVPFQSQLREYDKYCFYKTTYNLKQRKYKNIFFSITNIVRESYLTTLRIPIYPREDKYLWNPHEHSFIILKNPVTTSNSPSLRWTSFLILHFFSSGKKVTKICRQNNLYFFIMKNGVIIFFFITKRAKTRQKWCNYDSFMIM